jgi:DNA-binding LytR/AlgR family response regulator
MKKLPVKRADGSIVLIELDSIYYLEACGDDTLLRTRRKKRYLSVEPIGELVRKLPQPPFVHCHREFIVNLDRVSALIPRTSRDYDFKLDPPVNKRIPISRNRLTKVRKIVGL